ncbi:MAG: ABC transporter ATP-binding protein/permease [Clostridiales bacterium]|nr:ABC transporter ATP-binding protein/permease [Clostridiales bacterium]
MNRKGLTEAGAYAAKANQGARPPKRKLLRRLAKYLVSAKWLLLAALSINIISNLLALIGPRLSGSAIDAMTGGAGKVDFPTVFRCAGLMIVFYVISAGLSYLLSVIMISLSRKVVYELRRDLFNRLSTLPVGFFDKHQTGDIISVISYDVDTINASLASDLLQIVTSVITVAGSAVMMVRICAPLTLIFVVTVPLTIFFTAYVSKVVRPLFRRRSLLLGELNGYTEESIGGVKTTRAYDREDYMTSRYDRHNRDAADAYYKAEYYGSINGPSVNFINNLSMALVSVFGSLLFLSGGISLGNISSYVLYSRKFSGPINEFANIFAELQSTFAAADRVFRLMDELPEPADDPGSRTLKDVRGDVDISHVAFGYTPEKEVIHDLSLSAPHGTVVAIVGPTGAGKTTIINLLMRFYDVDKGVITVDGTPIRSVTRDSLRGSYTMVLQDTWLFHGTIFENIAYGREGVTREDVESACKAAEIHNYIISLPQGYDTILSDNGTNISKGQKQLLTIARAMLLDSRMLILDEATSNVDTQTEKRIQAAMLRLMRDESGPRTCFVIAHRLSTVRHADVILVVNGGDIVEQGRHDELMEKNGFYAKLYKSQFESW